MTRQELCNRIENLLSEDAKPEERDNAREMVGTILVEAFRALDAVNSTAHALGRIADSLERIEQRLDLHAAR